MIGHDDYKQYKDQVTYGLISGLKVKRALIAPPAVGCPIARFIRKMAKIFY